MYQFMKKRNKKIEKIGAQLLHWAAYATCIPINIFATDGVANTAGPVDESAGNIRLTLPSRSLNSTVPLFILLTTTSF